MASALLRVTSPSSFVYLRSQTLTLTLIGSLELVSVVLFLEAIKHIFVSYVVSIGSPCTSKIRLPISNSPSRSRD